LSEFLNEYLTPECQCKHSLHKLIDLQNQTPELKNDRDHQLKVQIAKAKLALRLGIKPVPTAEGANGAVFLVDPFVNSENPYDQYVAVFKAHPDYYWTINGIVDWLVKEKIKPKVGQARLLHHEYFKGKVHSEQYAEVAAYEFSKICDLPVVPASTWTTIERK